MQTMFTSAWRLFFISTNTIFQKGNMCHANCSAHAGFKEHHYEFAAFPLPQISPEINAIEKKSDHLDRVVRDKDPQTWNLWELNTKLEMAWLHMPEPHWLLPVPLAAASTRKGVYYGFWKVLFPLFLLIKFPTILCRLSTNVRGRRRGLWKRKWKVVKLICLDQVFMSLDCFVSNYF